MDLTKLNPKDWHAIGRYYVRKDARPDKPSPLISTEEIIKALYSRVKELEECLEDRSFDS